MTSQSSEESKLPADHMYSEGLEANDANHVAMSPKSMT